MSRLVYLSYLLCAFSVDTDGVIHGKPVKIEDAPFTVSISHSAVGGLKCGGSIVSSEFILTTASCAGSILSGYTIRAGSDSYNDKGSVHKVVTVIKHQSAIGLRPPSITDNNVALLKISPPIQIDNETTKTVQLATGEEPKTGWEALALGWGQTFDSQKAETLQGLAVKVIDWNICNNNYVDYKGIHKTQFCAKSPHDFTGVCNGDAGGPLMRDNYQIGLLVLDIECAGHGRPGVYMDISKYTSWINSYLNA